MMMKSVFWWRKPEYPEETTDLRQVTDETFHTYGLCPVRGLNLGRSGVKQSELRRDESGALAHRATVVPTWMYNREKGEILQTCHITIINGDGVVVACSVAFNVDRADIEPDFVTLLGSDLPRTVKVVAIVIGVARRCETLWLINRQQLATTPGHC